MTDQERAVMRQALERLRYYHYHYGFQEDTEAMAALAVALEKDALAQEQEQKQRLLEAVRVRIMQTAYDCADDGEIEAYNGVKVLCTEVLEMLK